MRQSPCGQPRPPDRARLDLPAPRGPLHGAHARGLGDGLRGRRADPRGTRRARRRPPAPRAALPPAAGLRAASARAGRCGPTTRTSTPTTTYATPRCRSRRATRPLEAPGRADLLPAPGPLQAAVGDLARPEHVRRALRADRQDPPRARRRHLRRRHHHRPVRHRPRTGGADRARARRGAAKPLPGQAKLLGEALHRALHRPRRDGPRRPRAAARAPARRLAGSRGAVASIGATTIAGIQRARAAEPLQRRDRPPPPLHLPRRRPRELQSDQGLARRHPQRRRPRLRRARPRALPAPPRPRDRRPRAEGDGARVGAHARHSAARSATRSPRCGRRCRWASERRRGAAQDRRLDGGPEEIRPGRGRPGAHQPRRLRAADDPQPGRAPAGAPAVLQPRRHERPRARSSRSTCSGGAWRSSTRSSRSPRSRPSGSPS